MAGGAFKPVGETNALTTFRGHDYTDANRLTVPQDKVETVLRELEHVPVKRYAPRYQFICGSVCFFYANRERIQVANECL